MYMVTLTAFILAQVVRVNACVIQSYNCIIIHISLQFRAWIYIHVHCTCTCVYM